MKIMRKVRIGMPKAKAGYTKLKDGIFRCLPSSKNIKGVLSTGRDIVESLC
jgi:hypothetical protein